MTLISNGDLRTDPNQGGVEFVEASGATAGQVLTSNGAGGATFETPSSGTGLTNTQAIALLATVTGIDGTATGQTTLYTVPVGKSLVITDLVIRGITVTDYTVDITYGVGITPNFNESISGDSVVNTTFATGKNYSVARAGGLLPMASTFSAGDVIKLDITTGGTATTLTLAIDLFGFLLDV